MMEKNSNDVPLVHIRTEADMAKSDTVFNKVAADMAASRLEKQGRIVAKLPQVKPATADYLLG